MNPAFAMLVLSVVVLANPSTDNNRADSRYEVIESRYVREFLRRYPVVSTALGGSGLYSDLAAVDGMLRDWSPRAMEAEARFYRGVQAELLALDPKRLSARRQIDRQIILHQIRFMLHQNQERKYWQRSVDTYVIEPFRGIDWYLQGMTEESEGRLGTKAEWAAAVSRVAAIPAYLRQATSNLTAGLRSGNIPDWRMIERDGIGSAQENAQFFEKTLPEIAEQRTRAAPFSKEVVATLTREGASAAAAFNKFRRFLQTSFGGLAKKDRYAVGAKEYDWALQNNLNVALSANELFQNSWEKVDRTRKVLIEAAQAVAKKNQLAWDGQRTEVSTRAVIDFLAKDYPRSDEEMIQWYRDVCKRLVEYGRRNNLFDIPSNYKLEVTLTPPALESAIDGAAYYPAPAFRNSGVGRFYVSPTRGDVEKLKQNNRASLADLAAHEGFPGHDWHYKVLTQYRDLISPVRWLTPGEVEGSYSMWEDSMAAEGWALYAESLLAEPTSQEPSGFYTPEERVYQLQAQLYRDLRVRVDTGLHTGKLGYNDAVDLFSQTVDFLPGLCAAKGLTPEKKASCDSAERAIFRYSKSATQAITYQLGKSAILSLRQRAEQVLPGPEGRKRFHLLFMQQGTIPPRYFEEVLLRGVAEPQPN